MTGHERAALEAAVAELYEDAGQPPPIILERPDPARSCAWMLPGVSFAVRNGQVEIISTSTATDSGHLHEPAYIRELAARIAEMAEQAEAQADEPDPAKVEELAELMDAEMERCGSGQFGLYPAVARIALRWMREREAAS